ncbi:hypothetical protein HDE_08384 [Halotydeus destructor]|nr:hypothetical protein HDE_08384 [Halotydeus destructor]
MAVIWDTMILLSVTVTYLLLGVSCERSVFPEYGHYSYHSHYDHDVAPARPLPKKIPFGMPMGGYSLEGRGPPFGLVAFYYDAYGHHFDFNSPWHLNLLRQMLKFSSELSMGFSQLAASSPLFHHTLHPFPFTLFKNANFKK